MDDIDDAWDPMREEYENPHINSYEHGPGVLMDLGLQRPAYRNENNMAVYKLFVSKIPPQLTEVGLENLFLNFGRPTVSKLRSNQKNNVYAFVEYATLKEAQSAMNGIDGRAPFNIRVTFARNDATRERLENQRALENQIRREALESASNFKHLDKDDLQKAKMVVQPGTFHNRNLRLGRGRLLIQAFPQSNKRHCKWSEASTDIDKPEMLLPDSNLFNASNSKVLQSLVIMSTTDGARKVAMGRGYIPPCQIDEHVKKPMVMDSPGVFREGEDVVVPAFKCSVCNSHTVMKCCQCGEPYCSKECQKADFPAHKVKCTPKMSIDISVDSSSMERSIKLGTLAQTMDTISDQSTPSPASWTRPEKHTLDFLTQGQSVVFRVISKSYPCCIGILSCSEIIEETGMLVVDLPNYFQGVAHDNTYRPAEGALVCVSYENSFWRGYVIGAAVYGTDKSYEVALCDQGVVVTVPFKQIFRLPLKYHDLPELTVQCTVIQSYLPGELSELWDYIVEENDYFMQIEEIDFRAVASILKDQKPVGKFLVDRWNPVLKQKILTVTPLESPCRVVISAYHDQHAVYVRRIGKSFQEDMFKVLQSVATVHVTAPPLGRRPRKGEIVACQFHRDKNFYRAVVCDMNSNEEFTVFFVDFGNIECVNADQMKALPEDLKLLPCLAIKVRLRDVPSQPLTEESVIFLNSLVQKEQELLLECSQDEYNVGVELFVCGPPKKSVNEELSRLLCPDWRRAVNDGEEPHRGEVYMLEDIRVVPLLPDQSKSNRVRVLVLNVLPDGRLSVCPVDRPEAELIVKTLSYQINEYCESFDSNCAYCPREREVCLAKFSDGLWYRAVNLRCVTSHSCEILFIDYGNIDVADFRCVRRMVADFTRTPSLVSLCYIDGLPDKPQSSLIQRVSEMVKVQGVYDVQIMKMYEEGEYKIHIPEISKQLLSEAQ